MHGHISADVPLLGQSDSVDAHCCFCFDQLDTDAPGSLTLLVSAAQAHNVSDGPSQGLVCHARCLGERLDPQVPFDSAVFD